MLASGSDFPKDDLMNCLRNGGNGTEEFIKQAKKLNIQWIYEIIKYCSNVLFEAKEMPDTKFTALILIKDLFQTCEVPCVHLIEVYILPIIYQFAIYKPQQKAYKRGNFFFQNNGYSARISNIQETGLKFIALCTQMVFFGSIVKKKRTFENKQLSQSSQFIDYFQKLEKYGIDGTPRLARDLKYFSEKTAKTAYEMYLKNLNQFENYSADYSQFFVFKMVESLQTEQNVLFSSAGKTVSSLTNDLDMRKILKYGDTYITSPLLQELTEGIKTAENFLIKRNFLSLLSDFVKWADIESFIQICYDDVLDEIAPRIAEISGQKGLNQGQFIYPQIKGQKQSKKKFYIEFLKNLEIWAKCIKGDLQDQQQQSKVEQLYEFLKVERKFVFPENLMSKRIEADFAKSQQFNAERNEKILQRLRNDKTSVVNKKKSSSINKSALAKSSQLAQEKQKKVTFEEINDKYEDCFQVFISFADNEKQMPDKMKKLLHFKQTFDGDLENIQQNDRPFEEFQDLLDNGDDLIDNIEALEDLYQNYTNKKIKFKKFQEEFEQILEQLEQEDEQSEDQSSNLNSSQYASSKGDASVSISKSKRSLKKMLKQKSDKVSVPVLKNDNPSKGPEIEIPNIKNQISQADINEKGNSTLSRKVRSKRESQLKQSIAKSSIKNKQSSMIFSNIPYESAVPESNVPGSKLDYEVEPSKEFESPYYENNNKNGGISSLSKLQNKSIHSKKSGIRQKLKKRKAEMSHQSSRNYYQEGKESKKGQSVVQNDYMMGPVKSEKKNFKQMIQSHRSSRISQNNSNLSSSFQRSIRKQKNKKLEENIVYYEKKDSVSEQFFQQPCLSQSQVLTEQVNEGQGPASVRSMVRKNSKLKSKSPYQSQQKVMTNIISIKSLKRDKSKKSNSILKLSRRSSGSGVSLSSAIPSKGNDLNTENKANYKNDANTDDYMIQPSKAPQKQVSHRISQLSNRPLSSRSKTKNEKSYPKGNQFDKQECQRPQTSSNHHMTKTQQATDHYQIRRVVYQEPDIIKEPQIKPMENSYYGIEEIEAKVKSASKMDFKQCFQIEKEVIPVGNKKNNQFMNGFSDAGPTKKGKSTNESSSLEDMNVNKNPQQEYLMMKLRREHTQEKNDELKKIQGRILKLKTETSKIRNDLTSRSQENKEFSLSRRSNSGASSRQFCSFSSSKNSRNSSYHSISKEKINTSRSSNITVEGRVLDTKAYDHHYNEIKDQNTKKTFLRSKAILLKNQYLQIGSIFRRERNNLKILMYLTPNTDIFSLNLSLARQYNMEVRVYPEVLPEIPKGKQVKITLQVQLKSAPFSMPSMFVNFVKGSREHREQKSYNIFLPCSLHRFIEFHPVSNREQFLKRFESVGENIIKTVQFRVSRRVGKLDHIQQYFPKLTTVLLNGDIQKYGAECTFKRERFVLLLTAKKPQNMVIQGIPLTRPQFLQYLLSFLKHIFTMDQ